MIRQPSSVIIAEPSGSGKSELLEKWLRYQNMFQVKPKTVVYVYQRWQPQAYCGFQVDVMFVLMPGPGSSHHKKKNTILVVCVWIEKTRKNDASSPSKTEMPYAVLAPLSPCERTAIKIKAWTGFANGTI